MDKLLTSNTMYHTKEFDHTDLFKVIKPRTFYTINTKINNEIHQNHGVFIWYEHAAYDITKSSNFNSYLCWNSGSNWHLQMNVI